MLQLFMTPVLMLTIWGRGRKEKANFENLCGKYTKKKLKEFLVENNTKLMNIFEKKYQETGFESQRKYPNESLVAFASEINGRVLDLGCGSGANTWFLAKEGKETYGIDSSPTAIKLC